MMRSLNLMRLGGIAVLVLVGASGCEEDAAPVGAEGGDAGADVGSDGPDAAAPDADDSDVAGPDDADADADDADDADAGGEGSDGPDEGPGDLGDDGEVSVDSGPPTCANVPATDAFTFLDDFEDGDNEMLKAANRTGFWSISDDDTAGAVRSPPDTFLPEHGGRAGSSYAAHFAAAGFKVWGAALNLTVLYQKGALFCSYNASKFAGIGFYAKGPGKIRFGVPSAAIVPSPENGGQLGGTCGPPNVCWDQHGAIVELTNDWAYYELGWRDLQQFGFGTGTLGDLDPGSITGVAFAVLPGPDFQPADFWIDDVRFVKTLTVADGGTGESDTASDAGADEP